MPFIITGKVSENATCVMIFCWFMLTSVMIFFDLKDSALTLRFSGFKQISPFTNGGGIIMLTKTLCIAFFP